MGQHGIRQGLPRTRLAGPEVIDFQRDATTLSGVAAIQPASVAITGGRASEQVGLARVTPNLFDVLGVGVAMGRTFAASDGFPAPSLPAILSWPLFQQRFGGDPSVIGQALSSTEPPSRSSASCGRTSACRARGRRIRSEPQIFQPVMTDLAKGHRLIRPYHVIARLADGATPDAAATQMAAISAELAQRDPIYRSARHTFYLAPLSTESTRDVRPMLLALLAGVIVVLVVTCVNVGGLLLARAAGVSARSPRS